MIQGVIFDMDGILFDTERVSCEAMRQVAAGHGLTVSDALLQSTMSVSHSEYENIMRRAFGPALDLERFNREYHEAFLARLAEGLPEKPGLHEALATLKAAGFPLAVASSSYYTQVMQNLRRAGVDDHFAVILGGDKVQHPKPDPDIYQLAAQQLGLAPEVCLAVEDSRNGIRSASSAGCVTVMIPDFTPPDDELRSRTAAVLDSLLDVPPFIERYNTQNATN